MQQPTEVPTLAGAIDELSRRGFTEHFAVAGGRLRALDSGRTFSADAVRIAEYQRFEGVSDPDDMAIVYAVETADGIRGTLVDAFGVYADPSVGAAIDGVPLERGLGRRPSRAA